MKKTLLVLAFAMSLASCAHHRERHVVVVEDGSEVEEIAATEPPPPQVEVIPVAPGPNSVWVGGRWGWAGGRYAWRPGRYVMVRPGHQYVAGHWERHPRGWVYRRAHWR